MLYIVTLQEMKRDLGLKDAQDDGALTLWLEGLQGRFEEHCERQFLRSSNIDEIHDGGDDFLFLKRWPVESVASVHVDVDQEWDADSLLESDDYLLNQQRGRLTYGRGATSWPAGVQNIRVVYTGGYVAAGGTVGAGQTAMPDSLRSVFVMQAGFEWRNRTNLGKESISANGGSVNLAPADFLAAVKKGLLPYRRILMP